MGDGPVVKVANFAELEQRNAVLYAVAKLWGSKLARAEEIVEAQALLLRTRREHVELELLVRDLGLSSAMPTSDGAFEEEKAPGLRARGSPSPATSRAARSRAFDALVKMIPALCDHLENDVVSGISRTRRAMQKCVAIRKKLFKDTEGAVDDAVQAKGVQDNCSAMVILFHHPGTQRRPAVSHSSFLPRSQPLTPPSLSPQIQVPGAGVS